MNRGGRLNTEGTVELLYRDHGGKRGFTIIMGKGVDKQETAKIKGSQANTIPLI
jgi:hypothetical protein